MIETVKLLWVKPNYVMPNVSISLSGEDLNFSDNLSINPININIIPESIREEFKQLQMEFFSELADHTITFDLRNRPGLHVEDNMLFGSLQYKEKRDEFKGFTDYMFLTKESNKDKIMSILTALKARYEMLIEKLLPQLKRYINEAVTEIINNFPDLRHKENDFKKTLRDNSILLEDATMDIEFFNLTFSKDDEIIKKCIDEAYESAVFVESKLLLLPEESIGSKFALLQSVAKRIIKYNVHEEEDLTEVGMYYNHIFKDIDTFKKINYQDIKNKLDGFPDFGVVKRKLSDAINA